MQTYYIGSEKVSDSPNIVKSSNPLTNNVEVWSDAQKNQYSLNVSETLSLLSQKVAKISDFI